VIEQKPVEKDFVGILQSAQIDVPLKVIVLSFVGFVSADDLLLEALDLRWEKSVQAELASLLFRECRTLVQPLAVQEIHSAREIRKT
jgi:hypothetical protein